MDIIKESCVETFEEAVIAEKNGADRIEICSDLHLDGLTPSRKLVLRIVKSLKIPTKVMIRPRSGDFCYNMQEIKEMLDDISYFKSLDVFGVVFGVLNDDNTVNISLTNKLVDQADTLEVTFHKAIDSCDNILDELRMIIQNTKVASMLTSGGFNDAISGHETIKEMIKIAGKNISIIIAGSVTKHNIVSLHKLIKGEEYHGRQIVDLLQ
ncbi:MAG: copper homeostasis protein CutC [Candidatus Neomarinimicrobiota bacterium]